MAGTLLLQEIHLGMLQAGSGQWFFPSPEGWAAWEVLGALWQQKRNPMGRLPRRRGGRTGTQVWPGRSPRSHRNPTRGSEEISCARSRWDRRAQPREGAAAELPSHCPSLSVLSLPVIVCHCLSSIAGARPCSWPGCGCLGSCCPALGCSRGCCSSSLLGKLACSGIYGAPSPIPSLPNSRQQRREHPWVPTEPLCSSFPSLPKPWLPTSTSQRPGRAVRTSLCPSNQVSHLGEHPSLHPSSWHL